MSRTEKKIAVDQNSHERLVEEAPQIEKHCATLENAHMFVKSGCDVKVLYRSYAQPSCDVKYKSKFGHTILGKVCSRKINVIRPRTWNKHCRAKEH